MSKNVRKCQNDIAKVGEERRKKERRKKKEERNRVHRGSSQNLKIQTKNYKK